MGCNWIATELQLSCQLSCNSGVLIFEHAGKKPFFDGYHPISDVGKFQMVSDSSNLKFMWFECTLECVGVI